MKRHKMVNLCPTTYEIAQKMSNFSGWIRKELMKIQALEFGLIWDCVPCNKRQRYRRPPRFEPECVYCGNPMTEGEE